MVSFRSAPTYQWGGKGSWEDLPILPPSVRRVWTDGLNKTNAAAAAEGPADKFSQYRSEFQKAEAVAALWAIPAKGNLFFEAGVASRWDDDRWFRLGFAFVDATGGGDTMLEHFRAWCSQDEAKYDEAGLLKRWTSWHKPGGMKAASLFKWASLNNDNWKQEFRAQWNADQPEVDQAEVEEPQQCWRRPKTDHLDRSLPIQN